MFKFIKNIKNTVDTFKAEAEVENLRIQAERIRDAAEVKRALIRAHEVLDNPEDHSDAVVVASLALVEA